MKKPNTNDIKLSERVRELPDSVTLAITARAKTLRAEGQDVIGFGAGEPDFDTPDNIKAAAKRAIDEGHTKYTAVGGTDELKDAIIAKLKRDNALNYTRGEILVSCGGKHSFYNLCQALLDPGDEVIVPSPYWVSYPPMVELAGARAKIVDTTETSGFRITPKALKEAVGKRTRAVVINSPSNPTGSMYPEAELRAIAEAALEAGLLIISDEIYEELTYGEVPFVSVASLSKEVKASTIVLNGVSKAYAMTGWRIGYAAGPAQLIKAMGRIQSQSTSNPTSISQIAAIEALGGGQDAVGEMREVFRKRRALMVDGLNSIDGVSCTMPHGAFYAFANVSGYYGKGSSETRINGSTELAAFLLDEALVAVVPGAAFGADDFVRLSFACAEEEIKKGVERIGKALSKLS